MVAKGVNPRSFALSSDITITAAAPSFIVEAFAAVTDPSFVKAGLSLGIFSNMTLVYSSSSEIIRSSPLLCGIGTGTTSFCITPLSHAVALRRYDSTAKASCSSRETPCFIAVASA